MFTVTSTIESGFVHVPEVAEWAEAYLHELTLFPNGTFADQVDSTSQALAWHREHEPKYRYGRLEYLEQMEREEMGQKGSGPHMCSQCNKEMQQEILAGFRCANCWEQWMLPQNLTVRAAGRRSCG